MDYRDRLATFGPMRPEGATIDEDRMEMRFTLFVDCEEGDHPDAAEHTEGYGYHKEHVLPLEFEVCGSCDGKGRYVNPSIDAGGITQSEWSEWDPEERAAYFDGVHDITCRNCEGKRVEPVVKREAADPESLKRYDEWLKSEGDHRREREYEIEMGC